MDAGCLQVFKEVAANTKLAGDSGMKAWKDCLDFGNLDGSDPIKMLDDELAAQTGEDAETTIAIMPTVRVNKRQYRGALEAPSVLRAICAGRAPSCTTASEDLVVSLRLL